MKKVIAGLIFMILFCSAAFCQRFIAVDMYYSSGGEHYIIENRVNVRSKPGMAGEKLFQLNAGDKVKITEYSTDWEWLFVDDIYAPWYKISSDKGSGYICGRYVSTKETVGDIDCDGTDEIFVCTSSSTNKNCPIVEYKMSFTNIDENHAIIKNGKIIPINLRAVYNDEVSKDPGYSIEEGNGLSPKVNFLVVHTGFGDGGGGWSNKRYFYFSDGSFKYFTTLESYDYECSESHSEILEFSVKNARVLWKHEKWNAAGNTQKSDGMTEYSWNGKDFIKK